MFAPRVTLVLVVPLPLYHWRPHESCERGSGEADARVSETGRLLDRRRSFDSHFTTNRRVSSSFGTTRQRRFWFPSVSLRRYVIAADVPEEQICRLIMHSTDLCQSPTH